MLNATTTVSPVVVGTACAVIGVVWVIVMVLIAEPKRQTWDRWD